MPDGAHERENRALRQRVAELQKRLAFYSKGDPRASPDDSVELSVSTREELLVEAERAAHMGSWIWNVATDEVHWSDELYRLLGYDPAADTASTTAFFRAVHPDDVERVKAASARGVATGVVEQVDYRVVRPDGSVRSVTMTGAILYDSAGAPRRIVGTVLDVTEERRLEEQLAHTQKMEAVGRLAAGVAHDLNGQLMVIEGNLDVLALSRSPETDAIRAAIVAASETISRLLAAGRSAPLRKQLIEPNVVVSQALLLLERVIAADIALRSTLGRDLPYIEVDPGMVGQCLVNLVLNARDAVASGGTIEVITRRAPSDPTIVEIAVRDDGVGMDDATRAQVFEPFFTTKAPGKGSGLGLAMVQGTVLQHGGSVTLASEVGQGSTFTLRLPASETAPEKEATPAPPVARPDSAAASTILVVDDQAPVVTVLRRMLESAGHRVLVAERPHVALELALRLGAEIDLIISDVVMPEMRGPALLQEILRSSGREYPVIFMSGYSNDDLTPADCVRLHKPFDRAGLLAAVNEALAKARQASRTL
jgi:two-component system, cell cycle sensor histidine kinase and response regulator CckA